MEVLLGFLIAVVIGMTGTGGGTILVPVLVLAWRTPPAEAVGVSLVFAAVVKMLAAPAYVFRRQFSAPALWRLLAGGLPGVVAGTLMLQAFHWKRLDNVIAAIAGGTTAVLAISSLCRARHRPLQPTRSARLRWLTCAALPIGVEVGFFSSGAGALGSMALLCLTPLDPAAVVGTDLLFGLGLSIAGGALHLALESVNRDLAIRLLAGGVAGALVGPWLATQLPTRAVRAALSSALTILGVQLFWRGIATFIQ
jgi:uncharacterized membrane protein YfcA